MLKVDILVVRRDGMSHDAFTAYWRDSHAAFFASQPIVRKTVRRYVQTRTVAHVPTGMPDPIYDGVAQLWFDDAAGWLEYLGSPNYADVIRLDELKFIEPGKVRFLFSEETVIIPA